MTRLKVETYKARINLFTLKKKNMEIIHVVIIQ